LKLATIRRGGEEVATVVLSGGAVPVAEILDLNGDGGPVDLLSLLESGWLDELRSHADGLEAVADRPSARAIPHGEVEYGPLYRRPRKIWGIGLNYVEHAGDLEEIAPSKEPASFMRPDTTIIGPDEVIRLPEQSEWVTGEAELGLIIGREAKNVSEEEVPSLVAGPTTILDITAEDILRKNPRYLTRAKSFDTFWLRSTAHEAGRGGGDPGSHGRYRREWRGAARERRLEHDVLPVVPGLFSLEGDDAPAP
jgi:2-keto-4-pentenoate hydratase/2-oxohepta-3-ene-1,7-dioic acid hydratase in catechol pathway